MTMPGKVYIVGAGPGTLELLTIKGLACIQRADTIIYDRLISRELLNHAKAGARLEFVGKSPGDHHMSQEEINELLVKEAQAGHTVTRLKGGDPFVFGRGGEEAERLSEEEIPFEVVPGITSAIAAPMYAGIPVTHRGLSSSFAVVTGHEDPDKPESSISWETLSKATDTLCFMMGMGNLPRIVAQLVAHGRDPETPVALVRWGTRPYQETLTGKLSDIAEKAQGQGFKSPAVIVIGDVVGLREKLTWFETKPLFNKRIVVTRAREQASVLSKEITELGGEPIEFPTIKITHPDAYQALDEGIDHLPDYQWLVFTSVNGVDRFFSRLYQRGYDVRHLSKIKICAIGSKTADSLTERGFKVDIVPGEYRAEALIDAMKNQVQTGERVLIPRAQEAREILPEALRRMGLTVDVVPTYQTVRETQDSQRLRGWLESQQIDAITFTSSSTVKNFVDMMGPSSIELLSGVHVACIGPITSETCQKYGITVDSVAAEYTIAGLVDSLVRSIGHGQEGLE